MDLVLMENGRGWYVRTEDAPTEGLLAPSLTAAAEIAEAWAKVHHLEPRLRIVYVDGRIDVIDPNDDPFSREDSKGV